MIAAIPLLLIIIFFAIKKFHKVLPRCSRSVMVQKISSQITEVFALISEMAVHKVYAWKIFLSAFISQMMMVIINYVYALSLDQNIGMTDMFFFIPLLNIVSLLPFTIGGLGLKEGAFVVFFGAIGISKESALAIALLNRSVLLLLSLIGGLLFLFRIRRE